MTVVVFMADPKNIFIYDYEFAKNVSPRDFTTNIWDRTDTNLVLFYISSEDQQILSKDHQGKKFFAKSVVFSWIVFWLSLVTFQIIAHWRIYQTVYGPALSDKGFYRKGIKKFQDPYDVNPNDVDLFVNEIYSSGGSDLHAHATFNTSRPITKPHWQSYQTVWGPALPDTGCNGKWMVKFLAPDAHWPIIINQTVGQQFSDIDIREIITKFKDSDDFFLCTGTDDEKIVSSMKSENSVFICDEYYIEGGVKCSDMSTYISSKQFIRDKRLTEVTTHKTVTQSYSKNYMSLRFQPFLDEQAECGVDLGMHVTSLITELDTAKAFFSCLKGDCGVTLDMYDISLDPTIYSRTPVFFLVKRFNRNDHRVPYCGSI